MVVVLSVEGDVDAVDGGDGGGGLVLAHVGQVLLELGGRGVLGEGGVVELVLHDAPRLAGGELVEGIRGRRGGREKAWSRSPNQT